MSKVLDELKNAIESTGRSRRSIALEACVSESSLSRWFSGNASLGIESIERLTDVLDLEIELKFKLNQQQIGSVK